MLTETAGNTTSPSAVLALLNRWLGMISGRTGPVFVLLMLMAVVMIILPLPTFLVDILIALNIALTLLILIVAFYAGRPVDFSALPSLLLISTLFRVSLSISTTRLILLDGDAGDIVAAFGDFVVGGQVAIGLVIFLVISVAQFVVITKGAERVAEVAARFSLDAMPGKQMSIDNDLRNGDIDSTQARHQRSLLEQESQLFGAMDGAMKFVKGDAIASLVILVVNLLGGLGVGVLSRGMSLSEAGHTYAILSVGDGLVAQLPSLLTALAAGLMVTRVTSSHRRDLGTELMAQLTGSHQALWATSGAVAMLALMPGFPAVTFLGLGGGIAATAFVLSRRSRPLPAAEATAHATMEPSTPNHATWNFKVGGTSPSRLTVHGDAGLCAHLDTALLEASAQLLHGELENELGITVPAVAWQTMEGHTSRNIRIDLDGIPIAWHDVPQGCARLTNYDPDHDILEGVVEGSGTCRGKPAYWVPMDTLDPASMPGHTIQPAEAALLAFVRQAIHRSVSQLIGLQETHRWLQQAAGIYPELVGEAARLLSTQRMASLLRELADDGIPLANARALLEVVVERTGQADDINKLYRHARAALARSICHRYADEEGTIDAVVLERPLERSIRRMAIMPKDMERSLTTRLERHLSKHNGNGNVVVVTADDIRSQVKAVLRAEGIDVVVLAYSDLQDGYVFRPVANIDLVPVEAAGE